MSFWLDNAMEHGKHILVDCGYIKNPQTRENVDQLRTLVGKKNIEIVYIGRVLVRIPPTKLEKIFSAFPEITEGESYSWCTHHWKYDGFGSLEDSLR